MLDWIQSDFMLKAIIAGIGVALPAAVVGCFLVWRRLTFFGDAMGHIAVLGIAMGTLLSANPYLFVLLTCIILALLLTPISKRSTLPVDVWLTILAYGALALGIILLAKVTWMRVEPESILFGDILGVDQTDLAIVYAVALLTISLLFYYWRPLLQMTVDEDLAATAGVPLTKTKCLFLINVSLVTAVGLKTVGALMLPGIMIIPAVAARRFSHSPEQMVIIACSIALLSVLSGIGLSFVYDLMTGPSIIMSALTLLILTKGIKSGK